MVFETDDYGKSVPKYIDAISEVRMKGRNKDKKEVDKKLQVIENIRHLLLSSVNDA